MPISGQELRQLLEEHMASHAFKRVVLRNIKTEPAKYETLLRDFIEKLVSS